jgi:CTP synthase (UTP-ammonia lyase)
MRKKVDIAIIGDFEARRPSHIATVDAIRHAGDRLSLEPRVEWIATPLFLTGEGEKKLKQCDGAWVSPGSPYKSAAGAIEGIRLARESGRPLTGT